MVMFNSYVKLPEGNSHADLKSQGDHGIGSKTHLKTCGLQPISHTLQHIQDTNYPVSLCQVAWAYVVLLYLKTMLILFDGRVADQISSNCVSFPLQKLDAANGSCHAKERRELA